MKILYYVTEHGLGHASRTVAITRELQKYNVNVIIRNNDPISFLRKSLPNTLVIHGHTDFSPVMNKKNGMLIDSNKTKADISRWIGDLPQIIQKESMFIREQNPDLVVSDISIMPILAARRSNVKSIAISSFVWNETLNMNDKTSKYFAEAYNQADLIIKLPLGTKMKFSKKEDMKLVARKITESKDEIRKQLGITKDKRLVVIALSGLNKEIRFQKDANVEIIDISNYTAAMKLEHKVNLVEGQNLINASDLVICKCGYGFVSECLSSGTKFRYLLEPSHKEAFSIHRSLYKLGLRNRISADKLKIRLDNDYIASSDSLRIAIDNENVAKRILSVN